MAQDWSFDVHKYAPDAPSGVIDAIVRYCGIALQKPDSSLVSFNQQDELVRVRENFLKKKLGLTNSDAELDAAISTVGERMRGKPNGNRVTVYYLLAEHFRRLSEFGGRDTPPIAPAGAAATATAMGMAGRPAAATVGAGAQAFNAKPIGDVTAAAAARPGWVKFLPWLLGAAILALLLGWLSTYYRPGGRPMEGPVATAPTADESPRHVTARVVRPAPAAVPAALPVRVYFGLDSAAIDPEAARAVTAAAYLVKRDGGRIAITGFTDRTGDLTRNEELARNRAVAVRDALVAEGVPLASIEMRPPTMVETGAVGATDADARRVEIIRL